MEKVTVSAEPLRRILQALTGPPHLIRELQVTMGLPNNPIDAVAEEYNRAVSVSHLKNSDEEQHF